MAYRYRIEYLVNPEEDVVCHSRLGASEDLSEVTKDAWVGALRAGRLFGATAFQIRDMRDQWKIVARHPFRE